MNKQNAIDKFIADLENKVNLDAEAKRYLREKISALVEEIYKEELKLADDRWKNYRKIIEKLKNNYE